MEHAGSTVLPSLVRRTVQTPSGAISVLDSGPGEDGGDLPVAVFVHGVLMNAWLWEGVVGRVADVRRCIAPDLLGHGETLGADPHRDLSFGTHADVLAEVIAALGAGPVDLVGNDSGGAVCQVLAVRHPELVRSLTLTDCDTYDHVLPEALVPFVEACRAGQALGMFEAMSADEAAARAFLSLAVEDPACVDAEGLRRIAEPLVRNERRERTIERWMNDLTARDLVAADAALPGLAVPALVVWGADDGFFPLAHAERLMGRLPASARLVEVPGARLFHPLERPDALAGPLRAFWGGQDAARTAATTSAMRSSDAW